MEEEVTVPSVSLTSVLNTKGKETITEGERGDIADTEESKMVSLYEVEGKTSTDEEGQESSFGSEEEVESAVETEDQSEDKGRPQSLFTTSLHGEGTMAVTQTRTDQTVGQGHGPSVGDGDTSNFSYILLLYQSAKGHSIFVTPGALGTRRGTEVHDL